MIKLGGMRWVGHMTCMGEEISSYRFWWGNLKERDHLKYLGIDGRIILKCMLKIEWVDMDWFDLVEKGSCWGHGNEALTS